MEKIDTNLQFINSLFLQNVILFIFILFSSCGNKQKLESKTYAHLSEELIANQSYSIDTIIVKTSRGLVKQIRSDRLIRLVNDEYILNSTLIIDSVKNLKIVATESTRLLLRKRNATVLSLTNCNDIYLGNLMIGHKESLIHKGEQGALRISHSSNINISNSKLFGSGTFGLITYYVNNLYFSNSEITASTILIFELEKSRNFEFKNSKFHNNNLATSVLGGFTNSTKDISFLNCDFLDNKPDMPGNPAFNFYDNDIDLKEQILFENCTFKNNKGFKWYGDKIKLINCEIDSLDFIGLGSH